MYFVWFSMWDGFFSSRVSESHPSRLRRGWDSETSGEKSISHGKPYKMNFLTYFTLQGTLVILNTLHKVEDHENHVRWIYLTTVLYMGSQKYARMDCLWPFLHAARTSNGYSVFAPTRSVHDFSRYTVDPLWCGVFVRIMSQAQLTIFSLTKRV